MTKISKRNPALLLFVFTLLSLTSVTGAAQACLFYKTTTQETNLWGLPEENTSSVQAVLPVNVSTCIEEQLPGANGEQWGRVSFYLSDEIRYSARGWVNLARFDKVEPAVPETKAPSAPVPDDKADADTNDTDDDADADADDDDDADDDAAETDADDDDDAMVDTLQAQRRELEQLKKKNQMLEKRMKEQSGKSTMKHMDKMKPTMTHGDQMHKNSAHVMKKGEDVASLAVDPLFLTRSWRLNGTKSKLRAESVLETSLIENHHFTNLSGDIARDGKAVIKVMLNGLETGSKMRNVRVAHLLFQSDKFPIATITTMIDKSKLAALAQNGQQFVMLDFMLKLHGREKNISARVMVSRMPNGDLRVASIQPIILSAADFALSKGITKLIEVVGGKDIIPSIPIRFNFIFEARSNPT